MSGPTPPEPNSSRNDLLDRVRRRGEQLRRRRRALTAVTGLAVVAILGGVASQVVFDQSNVNVLPASEPDASTASGSSSPLPGRPNLKSTTQDQDPTHLASRPRGPLQPCPPDTSEPSFAPGSYCGPEPPPGNGEGRAGECTGEETGPPCGPGAEPGRYYPFTLPGHCDGQAIFDGRRWVSMLPPTYESPAMHVWMRLDPNGSVAFISPSGAVGFEPFTGQPLATCRGTKNAPPPVCRDSYDDRCGPFRWDPQPENQPLRVAVTAASAASKVGEPIQFHVVVDDPDTHIDRHCPGLDYGDKSERCFSAGADCAAGYEPYGAWSPPRKRPDHLETAVTHTYRAIGTYTVRFTYYSESSCAPGGDPYRSEGKRGPSR